jgi:period circadian protein 2
MSTYLFKTEKNVKTQSVSSSLRNQLLLVISATPMKSIYKVSDENMGAQMETKFTTRHTAEGIISHVDGTASLLGFFPQDILGRKIFDFFHPEEMSLLKENYETIMVKGQTGSSFIGKPHRFLTQNGCYVEVETEWSSFVNPWEHHLEFVIGSHRITKGPSNPNIFSTPECIQQFSEKTLNESKTISMEILKVLSKTIPRPTHSAKQLISKEVLENIMEPLVHDIIKSNSKKDLTLDLPHEPDLTFSERDSVMLGEISPHHDHFDSKSSSETPPSYNQLNYNETLQRFFDSRPVTIAEPATLKTIINENDVENCTNSSPPLQCHESGGSSAGNMSSASNVMESMTSTGTSGTETGSAPPVITEALLIQHNENMEKLIIKRHKVSRTGKNCEKSKKSPDKSAEPQNHGIKRSISHSWIEGDTHKTSKQQHLAETTKSSAQTMKSATSINMRPAVNSNVNLWPPFSVSVTTIQNIHTAATAAHVTTSNLFPTLYYFPKNVSSQDQRNQQIQYVPGVLYQPMMYPSFYQMQFPSANPGPSTQTTNLNTDTVFSYNPSSNIAIPCVLQNNVTPTGQSENSFQRPPSTLSAPTSLKADIGSTSASIVNRVS